MANETMRMSAAGMAALRLREGVVLSYYNDAVNRCAYGVGTPGLLPSCILQASFAVFGLFFASVSCANNFSTNFTKPLSSTQSIVIENTNLSAINYFNALMGNSVEERRYAELYLLGVLDATEGSAWCDYKTYKTITIDETIFVEFKKLTSNQLDERAATVITKILRKKFPCRGIK